VRLSSLLVLALVSTLSGCSGSKSGANGGGDGGSGGAGEDSGTPNLGVTGNPPGCTPNPANFDIPGNGCDDDDNGKVDDVEECDTGLPISGSAAQFSSAIEICQTLTGAEDPRWGIASVEYKGAYTTGSPVSDVQYGIMPAYGSVIVPQAGASFGVLSTGWARLFDNSETATDDRPFKGGFAAQPGDPHDDAPPGYPKAAAGCPIDSTVHDYIDLKLVVRTPANAQGFSFDFDFWSGEWPEYVCSSYNDSFVSFLTSSAVNSGTPSNISFDSVGNPVSVNNGFLDACTPGTPTGCNVPAGPHQVATCSSGADELAGTGFGAPLGVYCTATSTPGASTGWLTSSSPITPGETITLELMIWDTGDQNYDSSVLLDHFQWLAAPTAGGTQRPPK
jgi:hypothetical protein